MKDMFPNVVSYNRFTELQKVSLLPLFAFFRTQLRGKCTGITKDNIDDRKPLEDKQFIKDIYMVSLWGIEGIYSSPYSEHYMLTEFIC